MLAKFRFDYVERVFLANAEMSVHKSLKSSPPPTQKTTLKCFQTDLKLPSGDHIFALGLIAD